MRSSQAVSGLVANYSSRGRSVSRKTNHRHTPTRLIARNTPCMATRAVTSPLHMNSESRSLARLRRIFRIFDRPSCGHPILPGGFDAAQTVGMGHEDGPAPGFAHEELQDKSAHLTEAAPSDGFIVVLLKSGNHLGMRQASGLGLVHASCRQADRGQG